MLRCVCVFMYAYKLTQSWCWGESSCGSLCLGAVNILDSWSCVCANSIQRTCLCVRAPNFSHSSSCVLFMGHSFQRWSSRRSCSNRTRNIWASKSQNERSAAMWQRKGLSICFYSSLRPSSPKSSCTSSLLIAGRKGHLSHIT